MKNIALFKAFRAQKSFGNELKSPIRSEAQARRNINAKFDAAQNNPDNAEHWRLTDGLDAASANSLAVRKVIRERARYEKENNGYLGGAVNSMARDVIGRGPRVLFEGGIFDKKAPYTDGKTFGEIVEAEWENWSAEVLLSETLFTAVTAWITDGECFAKPYSRKKFKGRVSLNIRLYEGDQVSTPWGQKSEVDGVVIDETTGEVDGYWLLNTHPGNESEGFFNKVSNFIGKNTGNKYSTDELWHLFTPTRPGQLRGVSEIHSALALGPFQRRYQLATVAAAETAANISGILETDTPDEGAAEIPLMVEMQVKRNTMISAPDGWKAKQLKPEQPTSTFVEFNRELVQGMTRSIDVPLSVALGNSSGYNYASGRLDHQGYNKSIDTRRDKLENRFVDNIVKLFLQEFFLSFGMDSDSAKDGTWSYTWDAAPHVDPVKDATADAINLKNHSETLASICSKRGQNWRRVIRQCGIEKRELEKEGLSLEEVSKTVITPDTDGSEPEDKSK